MAAFFIPLYILIPKRFNQCFKPPSFSIVSFVRSTRANSSFKVFTSAVRPARHALGSHMLFHEVYPFSQKTVNLSFVSFVRWLIASLFFRSSLKIRRSSMAVLFCFSGKRRCWGSGCGQNGNEHLDICAREVGALCDPRVETPGTGSKDPSPAQLPRPVEYSAKDQNHRASMTRNKKKTLLDPGHPRQANAQGCHVHLQARASEVV